MANADPCEGCGICCMHMRIPPFASQTDDDWAGLPVRLKREVLEHATSSTPVRRALDVMYGVDGESPCLWFDLRTGKCREYQWRPNVCREYEVGEPSCIERRKLIGLTVEGMVPV